MKVSGNSPNNNNHRVEKKGDVTRELLETSEIIGTIVPRLLRDNQRNGVGILHSKQKSKSSLKGRVQIEPPAGDGYIAGQKVLRKQTRAGGYDGKRR